MLQLLFVLPALVLVLPIASGAEEHDEESVEISYLVGWNFYFGEGDFPQDYAEAASAFRKAADLGHVEAQVSLGRMYANGTGVRQDYSEAAKWFRKAAGQGRTDVQYRLALMYRKGEGVQQDYSEAAKWLRKAADQGDASAQVYLGLIYEEGEGVRKNYSEAAKWYRKAADQGDALAQAFLGVLYQTGNGVSQNYSEAAKLYRKAADQGDVIGQERLGLMYERGTGVPQDFIQAHMWFNLAASRGVEAAFSARNALSDKMTPDAVSTAQQLVREWKVVAPDEESRFNPSGMGTGWLVSENGIYVTNAHVVDGASEIFVGRETENPKRAVVLVVDNRIDLAILQALEQPSDHGRPLPVFDGVAESGSEIVVLGFPRAFDLGDEIRVTSGMINA